MGLETLSAFSRLLNREVCGEPRCVFQSISRLLPPLSLRPRLPLAATGLRLRATAKGIVLQSLTLVRTSDLDFGTVAPAREHAGTVVDQCQHRRARHDGRRCRSARHVQPRQLRWRRNGGQFGSVDAQPAGRRRDQTAARTPIGAVLSLDAGGTTRAIPGGRHLHRQCRRSVQHCGQPAERSLYQATFDLTADYQ